MDNNVNKEIIKGKRPSSKKVILSVVGVICGLTLLFYGIILIANKVKTEERTRNRTNTHSTMRIMTKTYLRMQSIWAMTAA